MKPMDVVYECGPGCGCGPECLNRTSQAGLQFRLEVWVSCTSATYSNLHLLDCYLLIYLSTVYTHDCLAEVKRTNYGKLCRYTKLSRRVGLADHGILFLQELLFASTSVF